MIAMQGLSVMACSTLFVAIAGCTGGTAPSCRAAGDCDDGRFCNGAETCVAGECRGGSIPCGDDQSCDEEADSCIDAPDADGDGVGDASDQCPGTPPGTFVGAAGCAVHFVDEVASGSNDGSSWTDAFADLQQALTVATSGDEIWVRTGIYKPAPAGDARSVTFHLVDGVAIYGGFDGSETTRDDRTGLFHQTVLSGDLNGDDVGDVHDASRANNSYQVVTVGAGVTTLLDGFTISAGNAQGSFPADRGGGLYNDGGSPTLVNCTFRGNLALLGGAVFNAIDSSPTIMQCNFEGNEAQSGGGVYNMSTAIVINCVFSGNRADLFGGGMINFGDVGPSVINCVFSGNQARRSGGGMSNFMNSAPAITNCTFSENSADDAGLGVFNDSSSPVLNNSILWSDSAGTGTRTQIHDDLGSASVVNYCAVRGGWSGLGGMGNIAADPLFVDAAGPDGIIGSADDDLRLTSGSPAADAGTNEAVTRTADLAGNPRIANDTVDMGAYEQQDRTQ